MSRISAALVRPRIEALAARLRPSCSELQIAGSLRRGRDTIKDVEIVLVSKVIEPPDAIERDLFGFPIHRRGRPAHLAIDEPLDALLRSGDITNPERKAWGDRLRRFVLEGAPPIPVELYMTEPSRFGWILLIRTGPVDFSKFCVTRAKRRGLQVRDGGLYRRDELVQTPTEDAAFAALGWDTPTPEQRNDKETWPRWRT